MKEFSVVIADEGEAEGITHALQDKGIPTECLDCQTGYLITVPRWAYKIVLGMVHV
jgi:hypothetical protein